MNFRNLHLVRICFNLLIQQDQSMAGFFLARRLTVCIVRISLIADLLDTIILFKKNRAIDIHSKLNIVGLLITFRRFHLNKRIGIR